MCFTIDPRTRAIIPVKILPVAASSCPTARWGIKGTEKKAGKLMQRLCAGERAAANRFSTEI